MKRYRLFVLLLSMVLLVSRNMMRAEAISPEQAKQVAAQFMTARYEKAATPGLAAVFILHFCRIFAATLPPAGTYLRC